MSTSTIGGREVVFLQTFLMPENETAAFPLNFTVANAPVNLAMEIKFLPKDESVESRIDWRVDGDRLFITSRGMRSALGVSTSPVKIGEILGQPLGMLLSAHAMGAIINVTVQMMVGGKYD